MLGNVFVQLATAIQNRRQGFFFQRPLGSNPEIGLAIPRLEGDPAFPVLMLIAIETVAFGVGRRHLPSIGSRFDILRFDILFTSHSHSMVLGGFEEMS